MAQSGGDAAGASYASWINNPANDLNQIVFDNVSVAAGTEWSVTGLFGTFRSVSNETPITTLNWQIRQNMVVGSSTGTTLISGSGSYVAVGELFTIDGSQLTNGANGVNSLADNQAIWLVGADDDNVGGNANDISGDFAYGVLGRSANVSVVPEPSTVVLLGAGLIAVGGMARRRRAR